jgi:hypothetical protein
VNSTCSNWDGSELPEGLIALELLMPGAETRPEARVLVANVTAESAPVQIELSQALEFLDRHVDRMFISWDVSEVFHALARHCGRREDTAYPLILVRLIECGRWVDLHLLDRTLQFVEGRAPRDRDSKAILSDCPGTITGEASRDQKKADRDISTTSEMQLSVLFQLYDVLHRQAEEVEHEQAPARSISDWPDEPPAASEEELLAQLRSKLDRLKRHQNPVCKTEPQASETAGETAAVGNSGSARLTPEQQEIPQPRPTGLLGNRTDLKSRVACGEHENNVPALLVGRRSLTDLLDKIRARLNKAECVIQKDSEATACLKWDKSHVRLNQKNYLETNDAKMRGWLGTKAENLLGKDRVRSLPCVDDGKPTVNLEHWGHWAACDRSLWHCRDLFRMAELLRCFNADRPIRSRVESLPLLRSYEPNLSVYRQFKIPVFHPRPGRIFACGRVVDLRYRANSAICVRHGFAVPRREFEVMLPILFQPADSGGRPDQRVEHDVDLEQSVIPAIARELYIAFRTQEERAGVASAAERDERRRISLDWLCASSDADSRFCDEFDAFREDNTPPYDEWRHLADALLNSVPLGMSDELLRKYLEFEYGIDQWDLAQVQQLRKHLCERIAYGYTLFLEDQTIPDCAPSLNIPVAEAIERFVNPEYPETSGDALRNRTRGRRRGRFSAAASSDTERNESTNYHANSVVRRLNLDARGRSLGGRPTIRADSQTYRRQEMLMTADDVMMEIGFGLVTAGHHLLGIAGNEFVVELRERGAESKTKDVREIVSRASERVLKNDYATVAIWHADTW